MAFLKTRWLQKPNFYSLAAALATAVIRLGRPTVRVQTHWHPQTHALIESGQPVIYALWHGRMYGILFSIPPEKTGVLISPSTDGEFIVNTIKPLGFRHFIRGSHKRKGVEALRQMVRTLKEEKLSLLFMVDGPRGPRHHVKPGVVRLASWSQAPIIPVMGSVKYMLKKFTRSWDHFEFPMFFTPMSIFYGEPIFIPPDLEDDAAIETQRLRVEAAMHGLMQEADAVYGHSDS